MCKNSTRLVLYMDVVQRKVEYERVSGGGEPTSYCTATRNRVSRKKDEQATIEVVFVAQIDSGGRGRSYCRAEMWVLKVSSNNNETYVY